MIKTLAFASLVGTSLLLCSCSEDVRFRNAAPAVVQLGPILPSDDGSYEVTLVVADFEGDPADISMEWVGESGEVAPADSSPGKGHGLIGLTTSLTDGGTLHQLFLEGPPQGWTLVDSVHTRRPRGGIGESIETPSFDPNAGYPSPYFPNRPELFDSAGSPHQINSGMVDEFPLRREEDMRLPSGILAVTFCWIMGASSWDAILLRLCPRGSRRQHRPNPLRSPRRKRL